MATFLTLPREIRDQVCDILLREPLLQPPPKITDVRKANTLRDPDDWSARKIRYSSQAPAKCLLEPLLFVNRQLHDEVHEAIHHFQKCGGAAYSLDLLLEASGLYYPTWIQVAPYSLPIHTMHIQIRPFIENSSADIDPFIGAWRLGHLINSFLKNWLTLIDDRRQTKTIIVENLIINIIADPSLRKTGVSASRSADQLKAFQDFLFNHIDGFLVVKDQKYHVPWGPMLLSRVRKLTIVGSDSKKLREVDVEERAKACGVTLITVPDQIVKWRKKPEPNKKPGKFKAEDSVRYLTELHHARNGNSLQELLDRDQERLGR
jgi:hypothetical protein